MKAIILAAGRGSRLLPLTETRPKCLLNLGRATVLEHQLDLLEAAGVQTATVVTGCMAGKVEAVLAARHGTMTTRAVFNPFYGVADNLASCWMAREAMDGDFLLINGDTLFSPDLLADVLASPPQPVQVTIDRKPVYDADDVKVTLDGNGTRLRAIGKLLPPEESHGESIGLLRFMGEGVPLFRAKLGEMMRGGDGVGAWFLRAVDALAQWAPGVGVLSIAGHAWGELDTPEDYRLVRTLFASGALGGVKPLEASAPGR